MIYIFQCTARYNLQTHIRWYSRTEKPNDPRVHIDTRVQSTCYVTEISTSQVKITGLNILIRTSYDVRL
jgi:hypothetical protein